MQNLRHVQPSLFVTKMEIQVSDPKKQTVNVRLWEDGVYTELEDIWLGLMFWKMFGLPWDGKPGDIQPEGCSDDSAMVVIISTPSFECSIH